LIWLHPSAPQSYYKNARGRNIMSCPYRLVDYWWMTRSPKPEDFALGGELIPAINTSAAVKSGT
jgi:4-hydroxyacetophenone monooxygenase